jgi:tetratricopeptide (TPR) repeat protein
MALGDVARSERNAAEAEDFYLQAKGILVELLQTSGHRADVEIIDDVQIDLALAKTSLDLRAFALAKQRVERAWARLAMAQDQDATALAPARAITAQLMGRVLRVQGSITEARAWFDRSLALSTDAEQSQTRAATSMYRLLLLVEHADTFGLTIHHLIDLGAQALALAREGPFPPGTAVIEATLAGLFKAAGSNREAKQHYRAALRFQSDDRLRLAHPDLFDLYQQALIGAA